MSAIAIVNGSLVDPAAPALSVLDAAVLHGDAYFETLRTYERRPALLHEHLARLSATIAAAGFPGAPTIEQLADEVAQAVSQPGEGEVVIRITVSRGVCEFGLAAQPAHATRIVTARPVESTIAGTDATVTFADVPGYAYPYKSANYQTQARLLRAARADGFDEVLIADGTELIEGATSNVFMINGRELATPELGRCLPGITRQAVIALAPGLSLEPAERAVSRSELAAADGVFICNSLIELRAVSNLGAASDRIAQLRAALREHYREEIA